MREPHVGAAGNIRWLSIALLCVVAIGCRSGKGVVTRSPEQLPQVHTASEVESDRLAIALKGLKYDSDLIEVSRSHVKDRGRAIQSAREAEIALVSNVRVKAAGLFRDAILADRTYAPAYEGLARALLMEGNHKLVQAALRTAISLDPNADHARYELGVIAHMKGDYGAAITVWNDLASRNPGYKDVYSRLAIASYFNQDIEGAWVYLLEADRRKQPVPPQFRDLLRQVRPRP